VLIASAFCICRENAQEAIRCIQALQEFASVDKLKDLPEFYNDDNHLAEAAVSAPPPTSLPPSTPSALTCARTCLALTVTSLLNGCFNFELCYPTSTVLSSRSSPPTPTSAGTYFLGLMLGWRAGAFRDMEIASVYIGKSEFSALAVLNFLTSG